MAAHRPYRRKVAAPIRRPERASLPPPPPERPRMVWRREDGRGDIPEDLWALMQEGGRRLAEAPSAHRAAQLLALTEHAAFKTWVPGTPTPWANDPLEPPRKPLQADDAAEWWETAGDGQKSVSDALTRFAEEAHAALAASEWEDADGGEVPREPAAPAREWWE